MKTQNICAYLLVMLSFSAMAMSEVFNDGYWIGEGDATGTKEYSGTYAAANGNDNWDFSAAEGVLTSYTTESATLNYSGYVYAWAEGHLWLYDYDTCWVGASAGGSSEDPFYTYEKEAYVDLTDSRDDENDPEPLHVYDQMEDDGYTISGSWYFNAWEGLDSDHRTFAAGNVPEGSDCSTYAHGCVVAYVHLFEP